MNASKQKEERKKKKEREKEKERERERRELSSGQSKCIHQLFIYWKNRDRYLSFSS